MASAFSLKFPAVLCPILLTQGSGSGYTLYWQPRGIDPGELVRTRQQTFLRATQVVFASVLGWERPFTREYVACHPVGAVGVNLIAVTLMIIIPETVYPLT